MRMPLKFAPRDASIFVVEARQGDGRWKPIAAPAEAPFTRLTALKRLRKLKEKYPHMNHRCFSRRVRIQIYVPLDRALGIAEFLDDGE